MTMDTDADADRELDERPSKSQRTREMKELHGLGKRLVGLPAPVLRTLPMTETLLDAVMVGKKVKRSALRRQLLYIEGVLRTADTDAIRRAMDGHARPHQEEVRALHQVEQWRDALIAGDEALLDELTGRFDGADRQHLGQLVRNARKELRLNKAPKSARALYRYLAMLPE